MLAQVKMNEFNKAFATTPVAVSANTATHFQMKDKHWKYLIMGKCATAGNITFTAGDSALAGGDLVIPIASGSFAITIEDALVKSMNPVTIGGVSYLDVVTFTSSVALTEVVIVKLP